MTNASSPIAEVLSRLDALVSEQAQVLFNSVKSEAWGLASHATRVVPDGSVVAQKCTMAATRDVAQTEWYPVRQDLHRLYDCALDHWRLTQDLGLPRWYKMKVTVERSGKFSADFEYKDEYKEGDIMQRG